MSQLVGALPPEQEARIVEQCQTITSLFDSGDPSKALALADEVWNGIPGASSEDKAEYYMSQFVTADTAAGAARAGARDGALLWLERFMVAYHQVQDPVTLLQRGAVHYWLGDLDSARQFFAQTLRDFGKRPFREENPDFLKLAQGKKVAAPKAATPAPDIRAYDGELGDQLAEAGNDAMDTGDWRRAIDLWHQGLALIPEPKTSYGAAGWFWGSIADASWFGEQCTDCVDAAQQALAVDDMRANPLPWLRLGQAQAELGQTDQAVESLTSAFVLGGPELFDGEDPRYLRLLRGRGVRGV